MIKKELEKLLFEFIDAKKRGDCDDIKKISIDLLFTTSSFFDIIFNYIFLEKIGIHFDFGSEIIRKGTILYRVRKKDINFDVNDYKEWGPSPSKKENRANKSRETAMYFNVMSNICELETHLKQNDRYAIGRYEVIEDMKVGGFLNAKGDYRLFIAGVLLNSFLIAPCRCENNDELFNLLDNYYGKIQSDDITKEDILKRSIELPLKLSVIPTKKDKYYKLTNLICDNLKKDYPEGIKYSSCYLPIETIRISSNCYNLVLYENGIKKIKFLDAKEYVYEKNMTSTDCIKLLLDFIEEKKYNEKKGK